MPSDKIRVQAKVHSAKFTELAQVPISIRLGGYQLVNFWFGFYEPRFWRNYLHTHTFFEICYAYQGTGTFRMLGTEHRVNAGDLFVAKPGEEHEIISSRRDPLGIYFWAYTQKRGQVADDDASTVNRLLDLFARSTRWIASDVPSVETTLQLLTEEIRDRKPGYPQVIDGLIAKLTLDTARAIVSENIPVQIVERPSGTEAEAIVATASRYVRDNMARPIALRDVAAQVHVSERHLGRLFNQIKHTTVLDYITHLRLETAASLLLDEQWAVKKVAASVGYPDVQYFTTLFRKRMKLTPAVFRKRRGTAFANESKRGKYK